MRLVKGCRGADCNDPKYCIFIYNPKTEMYDPIYGIEIFF